MQNRYTDDNQYILAANGTAYKVNVAHKLITRSQLDAIDKLRRLAGGTEK